MAEFDFIIIGAGSAGCVLADRLSRSGQYSVAIIEAGGADSHPYIKLPIGYGRTFYNPKINWKFTAQPDPGLANRAAYWPRGKVLGGSSSINALVYCRGLKHDFEDWAMPGWDWRAIQAAYTEIETRIAPDGSITGSGQLHVTNVSRRAHPIKANYLAAGREIGLRETDSFNGDNPEGVGLYEITTRRGMRHSAASAFLNPALKRNNVTLIKNRLVDTLTFTGARATGIRLANGQTHAARREVILSAGAIGSVQILQRSGIGPGAALQNCGIETRIDNPNVGGNLQDHLGINYYYKSTVPTLNNRLAPWWGKLLCGLQYLVTRGGPLSLSVNQCGGFVRAMPGDGPADTQLYFNPATYTTTPDGKREIINPDPFAGFLISFQPCRPQSRGRVDISAKAPDAAPHIAPNSLATNRDRAEVLAGARLVQRMMASKALGAITKDSIGPTPEKMDDAAILDDFAQRGGTVFHPVATCRMAPSAKTGVLDARLRVFGTQGLRVIDASSMPNLTSGNTNAPTIMLAWRAADMVLADQR
ncbi:MAG: GMC family oxidoreductase N-terminal domain-containing protein [Paracoccaceae bacterium]